MIDLPIERIEEICRRYKLQELSLFGSVLREDFGAQSDVDVLIEPGPETPRGFSMIAALQEELEAVFDRPVDLVTKGGLSKFLKDEVLGSRRTVYVQTR